MDTPDYQDSTPPPRAPKPDTVDFQIDFDALTMTFRWRSMKYLVLLFVSIAWDGFSAFWLGTQSIDSLQIATIAAMISALLGLVLTYYTVAGFLNRTMIIVNLQSLTITHGPLPWRGSKHLEITRISQLYAEGSGQGGGTLSPGYRLHAILRDNSRMRLLSGLPSPDFARFIEQSIEEYLHIEDWPVAGELAKY